LLHEFEDTFTDVPGTTDLEFHKIELTDKTPIRVRQYTIPYTKRTTVEVEIKKMLKCGFIEPANFDYNSPIVFGEEKG
jgi:hypothetical protein